MKDAKDDLQNPIYFCYVGHQRFPILSTTLTKMSPFLTALANHTETPFVTLKYINHDLFRIIFNFYVHNKTPDILDVIEPIKQLDILVLSDYLMLGTFHEYIGDMISLYTSKILNSTTLYFFKQSLQYNSTSIRSHIALSVSKSIEGLIRAEWFNISVATKL